MAAVSPVLHVVAPGSTPGAILWVLAGFGVAAVQLALFGPARTRRAAVAAAGVCVVAVVVLELRVQSAPPPPGYAIRIVSPAAGARVSSPVTITVCGREPGGSAAPVPGADRVLSVSVDGVEVASGGRATVIVPVADGSHQLRVEVLTRDHVRFSPVLAAEARITVAGSGPVVPPPPCA